MNTNVSVILFMPFVRGDVYFTIIIIQLIAISLNLFLIHIVHKAAARELNRSVALGCLIQICQATTTFSGITFFYFSSSVIPGLSLFASMDFMCKGLYVWWSIFLTASRIIVVRNCERPLSQHKSKASNVCGWIMSILIVLLAFVYETVYHIQLSNVTVFVTRTVIQITVIWQPFLILLLLIFWLSSSTRNAVSRQNKRVGQNPQSARCTVRQHNRSAGKHRIRSTGNQRNQYFGGNNFRKVVYSILCHTGYTGTAGNGFESNNGMKFTTRDRDNDLHAYHCGLGQQGAWWYSACGKSSLNGIYKPEGTIAAKTIYWKLWGPTTLKATEIKIRPIN